MDKSAQSCAQDIFQIFGKAGWVVLKSLTGKDFETACDLFESVMPDTIAAGTLLGAIKHLEATSFKLDDPRFKLREEMLQGAYLSRSHYQTPARAVEESPGPVLVNFSKI